MFKKTAISLLLLCVINSSFAIQQPDSTSMRIKEFRSPILNTSDNFLPAQQLSKNNRSAVYSKLSALGVQPESAFIDQRSGRFGTLITSIPLLPGKAKNNNLKWSEDISSSNIIDINKTKDLAWDAFISFVSTNRSNLNIDVAQMQNPGTVTVLNDGALIQINSKRTFKGIKVRNSFVTAVINNGNLVLTGTRNWGDINLSINPAITQAEARLTVEQYLSIDAIDAIWGKSEKLFIPVANGPESYKLVHAFQVTFPNEPLAKWEALVDANSNELIAFEDKTAYAEVKALEGGQYPISNDGMIPGGIEVISPMPYADLTVNGDTYYTDTGGNVLACLDGSSTTQLKGRYLTMVDQCGSINETDSAAVNNLGTSGGTDCTVPAGASAGNTHASRSGYYEINRMIEMAQGQLPNNSWIRNPVPATMNVNNTCNASGGPGGFNFFRSGGGCSNTGELAGVFDHEWGHGMDGSDANPGFQNPTEGIADSFAALRLNTSCMGRNFRSTQCSGFGDACTDCTGVRDIDWAKHASGTPHDLAWADANCGSGPSPCGGIVHCEGMIVGESVWDFWNRDLPSQYGLDINTSREIATQLTFQGSGPVGDWYNCAAGTGTGNGCNADGGYLNYLAADDDNGDLTDGTPHMAAIYASFDRHGIACATPSVQNNGCANTPTAAPNVSITSSDRTNELSWNSIAGATGYRVYRTEGELGCDFGKTLIAETQNLSYIDTGLSNGREYYYTVIPMGSGASCFGVSSSCSTGVPVPQVNFGIDAASIVLNINTGDNDEYIDNCEIADVSFAVANLGSGSATNVFIDSINSISHPAIDGSIVLNGVSPSGIAECSNASTGFSFEAENLAYGEVLTFNVCVSSSEIAPAKKCGIISFSNTQSNDQFFASKTFDFEQDDAWVTTRGTFNRTSGSSASGSYATRSSSQLNNQCDEIVSPTVTLSATSTLSMSTNFDIEGGNWDRANVSLLADDDSQTVISPDSGRSYNASNNSNYAACNSGQSGWGGTSDTWAISAWSSGALNAAANQNKPIKLVVNYATDGAVVNRGFWFDDVTLTDVSVQVADTNSCLVGTTYTVGGTISDLVGSLTLTNNGTDSQVITDADPQNFVFAPQADSTPYLIAVASQPTTQTCGVNNGSGSINGNDVTNVSVVCVDNFSTANADQQTVFEDSSAVIIDVLANDSVSVNGAAPITDVTQSTDGVTTITNNGDDLSYQPTMDYCNNGVTTDDFTYTITGGSSADVAIDVTCVNDAPTFDIEPDVYIKLSDLSGLGNNTVACHANLGPGDENTTQSIDAYSVDIIDPDNTIASLSVSHSGVLNATYTGNSGTAIIDLTLKDNGGTLNGGVDEVTKQMNIHVYDFIFKQGFDLEVCQ